MKTKFCLNYLLGIIALVVAVSFNASGQNPKLTDFYQYSSINNGKAYKIQLVEKFKTELNKSADGVFESNGFTWKTGDPLPNPAPEDNGNYSGKPVSNMLELFKGCAEMESIDISLFNTTNVTTFNSLFYGCTNLKDIKFSALSTNNLQYMNDMFHGCSSIEKIDISMLKTNKVTTMANMFYGCVKLGAIDFGTISTAKVTKMGYMFYSCNTLTTLDLSNFETTAVIDMTSMFEGCRKMRNLDLKNFSVLKEGSDAECRENFTITNMFKNCSVGNEDGFTASAWAYDKNVGKFFNNSKETTSIDTTKIKFVVDFETGDELNVNNNSNYIYSLDNKLIIVSQDGQDALIYTVGGNLVKQLYVIGEEEIMLPAGLYIVKIGNQTAKTFVKQ